MPKIEQIGFGGGCHWCTEGVFTHIKGVGHVKQGYIRAIDPHNFWSEAVLLSYEPEKISLRQLIDIHLRTHAASSAHSLRHRYRSAVYFLNQNQETSIKSLLQEAQEYFDGKLITQALKFEAFKESRESLRNYYGRKPNAPFCQRYIEPKLVRLKKDFKDMVKD